MKPGKNLVLGSLLFVVAFAASAVLLYGGAKLVEREDAVAEAVDGGPSTPGGPATISLVAKDLKFDKRSVSASVGGDVTIMFDNQDPGVPHNVGFYTNNRATQSIFVGQLITGPTSAAATFKAPAAAGNYYFRCDAHPDTMNGTFSVR